MGSLPGMSGPPGYQWGPQAARGQLSRHLVGHGVELGPGHVPFPLVMPSATVRYLDAWSPDGSGDRFPEVDGSEFVAPDTICDFNAEGLAPLADGSQDFVIASHVLEHLANPLAILCEMHRVLRPGGTLLILLPDRHNTFDRVRAPTPLAHLVDEFERGVKEVDDDHIEEFLHHIHDRSGGGPPGASSVPDPNLDLDGMTVHERSLALLWLRWDDVTVPAQRRELIELHRRRSIHAHVWDAEEFLPVVLHAVRHLGHGWELLDGLLPGDPGGRADEFGLVLRRAVDPLDACERAERLDASWRAWREYRLGLRSEVDRLRAEVERRDQEHAELVERLEDLRASAEEAQRAADEAVGVLHRLGQGRGVAAAEISAVGRRRGGEAVPELVDLLLAYRNHPFRQGTRRHLGKLKRALLRRPPPS